MFGIWQAEVAFTSLSMMVVSLEQRLPYHQRNSISPVVLLQELSTCTILMHWRIIRFPNRKKVWILRIHRFKISTILTIILNSFSIAILNLVTKISGINFHPSSELMSIYSDVKETAVRLVHFPSLTVFKNFPSETRDSAHFISMDFSPGGGYMAAGNNRGSAFLYRLNHYEQYWRIACCTDLKYDCWFRFKLFRIAFSSRIIN